MSVNGIGLNHGDEYYTPKYVVDRFGVFDYDPATTSEKAKEFGISNYDTIETDGLSKDWTKYKRIWINPPFTKKVEFLSKAQETYAQVKNDIYVLFPIGFLTTQQYSNINIKGRIFIPNWRINFEHTYSKSSPSMGSVILKVGSYNSIEFIVRNQGEKK